MNIRDRILELRRVPASQIAPSPVNWRTHPKAQSDALRGILAEIGFAGAILARVKPDGTLEAIDGHLRLETMGAAEVPVLVTDLSEAEAKTVLATFDPLGAMAETNTAALEALLRDVQSSNEAVTTMLEDLAVSNGIIPADVVPGGGGDEFDATPADSGPTRTNPGELWLIGGKHRLLVGDCTVKENVERLMGGERAGLCFTSPPYAQQREYGETAKEKVKDWDALMQGAFGNVPMADDGQVLVNLGIFYRDGDWVDYWTGWTSWMSEQGWRRFGWYIWDKLNAVPGDWCGRCGPCHEWVFHFNRKAREANHIIPKKLESIRPKTGLSFRHPDGTLHTANYSPASGLNTHKIPDSVWRMTTAKTGGKPEVAHPAVYPVSLPSMGIETFTGEGESVYDPFLGSGTTLIAAHRLSRRCYGMEIEPRYADVILKRCEAEGLTCELLDTVQTESKPDPVPPAAKKKTKPVAPSAKTKKKKQKAGAK